MIMHNTSKERPRAFFSVLNRSKRMLCMLARGKSVMSHIRSPKYSNMNPIIMIMVCEIL